MNFAQLADRVARSRRALRKELDRSLQGSSGAWWIPSIVACALCAWLASHERKQAA